MRLPDSGILITIEDKWQYIRDMFSTGKQHVQLISAENTLSPFAKPLHDDDHDYDDGADGDGDDGDDGDGCDDDDHSWVNLLIYFLANKGSKTLRDNWWRGNAQKLGFNFKLEIVRALIKYIADSNFSFTTPGKIPP